MSTQRTSTRFLIIFGMISCRRAGTLGALFALGALLVACGPPQPGQDIPVAPRDRVRAQLAETPTELGGAAVPTALDLRLTLDPERDHYDGEARWTVDVLPDTTVFRLHACEAIELGDVALKPGTQTADSNSPAKTTSSPAQAARVTRDGCVVSIQPDNPLAGGRWTVTIPFSRPWSTARIGGFYRFEEHGQYFVASQLGSRSARQALPVFDEPIFKPRVSLQVLAPPGITVAANGTLVGVEPANGDQQRHVFAETPPLPTYVLAVTAGPFEAYDGPHARILATRPLVNPDYVLSRVEPLSNALETLTGSEHPYRKPDLVALGQLLPEAMENPGIITFRHNVLNVGPGSPFEDRQYLAWVIAHELAHMWIGNMVTMRWWDDIWINESLATWLATRATVMAFPALHADLYELEKRRGMMRARLGSAPSILRSIRSDTANSEIFVSQVYHEGAAIVDWMAAATGLDTFLNRLQSVLDQRRFDTVNRTELLDALLGDGAPLAEPLLAIDGLPRLSLEWRCTNGLLTGRAEVRTQAWVPEPQKSSSLEIPVCLSLEGGDEPLCRVLSDGADFEEELSQCPAWLHPNAGEHGYYTWSLEPESLASLVENAGALLQREQGMLPFHLGQMVLSGDLEASHGFELLARASARVGARPAFAAGLLETLDTFEGMPALGGHPHFRYWATEVLRQVSPLGDNWSGSDLSRALTITKTRLAPEPPDELLPDELIDPAVNTKEETFAALMEIAPWSGPELVDVAVAGYGADGICQHPEVGRAMGLTREAAAISALNVMQSCPYGDGVQAYIETLQDNPSGARAVFEALATRAAELSGFERYFFGLTGMAYCHAKDERELLRASLLELGWDTSSIGAELDFQQRCWKASEALESRVDQAFEAWAP